MGSSGDQSEQVLESTMSASNKQRVSRATLWNRENEAEFEGWNEKFTTYIAAAWNLSHFAQPHCGQSKFFIKMRAWKNFTAGLS